MNPLNKLTLATLRIPAKLLLTSVLFTLGTGYLFAISNVALKIGFLPDEVALHYFGNESSRQALEEIAGEADAAADAEGGIVEEEAFSFDDLEEETGVSSEPFVPVKTLETLISEGHFHLFGYTSIFFLCGLVIIISEIPRWLKNILIVAPFAASVLDIWSMLLTRFIGPNFSWMLIISGSVMAISFAFVFAIGVYQLWFMKPDLRES
jgi:hypothetical protein